MLGEITLAMTQRLGLRALANVIHPYPTQADAIRKTGDLHYRLRLNPRVEKLLAVWHRWMRGR